MDVIYAPCCVVDIGRTTELQSQLKVAKSLADTAKQDLSDYKDKAMRILQVAFLFHFHLMHSRN